MLSTTNPVVELVNFARRPHFDRYAILLLHLLLLPLLSVLTEGYPKAELLAMVAEQLIFLGAMAALGGRRMILFGLPLIMPGLLTATFTFAAGHLPTHDSWFWPVARAVTFIVPIMTVGMLILIDVLAAKKIVFDMICGALCVFVLFGMCWANLFTFLQRIDSGSFTIDFARYNVDPATDPLASAGVFTYYSFVTLTTVGYGDIVPASALARWLVWLEAVFGQFYIAVFVSRLIGLQVSGPIGNEDGDAFAHPPAPVAEPDKATWHTRQAA